jgi:di/tricarboxylate transporter
MPFNAVITLIVLIAVLVMLIASRRPPDLILWAGVIVLMIFPGRADHAWRFGILDAPDALAGFANAGVITLAALFIVAAGLRDTGMLQFVSQQLLGRPQSVFSAQNRIVWPTALVSAFLNNTPVVAILLPAVDDWARRHGLSISRLLMPLSFAAILGGACTLIGTSSNLIVNGWLIAETGQPGMGLFEITKVGLPVAVAGIIFMLFTGRWLLKDRTPVLGHGEDARRYTVEMIVEPGGPIAGKSVRDAGLRGLPGLYLIEVDRNDETLSAVSAEIVLQGGDRLIFAGIVESVVDLQKFRGLRPATNQVFKLDEPRPNRHLLEAVVSQGCPLVGKSIREGRFRTNYNAAVIAVARHGERVDKRIGDIVLQPGDTLLLEARSNFLEQQRNRNDFYLVSKVDDMRFADTGRGGIAFAQLAIMVVLISTGLLSMLQAAMLTAALMIISGCCSVDSARRAVDVETLLVIVAALGLGRAMDVSGLAEILGDQMLGLIGFSPHVVLAVVFGITMLLGNAITAKAGAVLMLPVILAVSQATGIALLPLIIAVMLASATSLASPIGFPTNLMIYGVGGYRFSDYLRLGIPLSLLIWVMAVMLIPVFWPL